jgi:hypothetical protein
MHQCHRSLFHAQIEAGFDQESKKTPKLAAKKTSSSNAGMRDSKGT